MNRQTDKCSNRQTYKWTRGCRVFSLDLTSLRGSKKSIFFVWGPWLVLVLKNILWVAVAIFFLILLSKVHFHTIRPASLLEGWHSKIQKKYQTWFSMKNICCIHDEDGFWAVSSTPGFPYLCFTLRKRAI